MAGSVTSTRNDVASCRATARAVDNSGYEITLKPWDPGFQEEAAPRTASDRNSLTSVACPSLSQCTAIDNEGREVTFDPA